MINRFHRGSNTRGCVIVWGQSNKMSLFNFCGDSFVFNILNTGRNELPRSNVSSMQNTKFKQSWLYYVGMENILFSLYNQPIRSRLMFCSPQSVSEVSQKGLLDFLGIVLKTININLVLSNAKLYLQTLEITEEQF